MTPFEDIHCERACPYYGDGFERYTEAEPRQPGCICWLPKPYEAEIAAGGLSAFLERLAATEAALAQLIGTAGEMYEHTRPVPYQGSHMFLSMRDALGASLRSAKAVLAAVSVPEETP